MTRLPPLPMAGTWRETAGSVIILTLWTLFFLAALAIAVGAHVSAGIRLARSLRDESRAYYAARAGVEYAFAAAVADTNKWDSMNEDWRRSTGGFQAVPFGDAEFSILHTFTHENGSVVTNAGLIDEESKININTAGPQLLRSLLQVAGGVSERTAGDVAFAILDWRDGDDEVSKGGAESAYYASLGSPYKCHNGPFDKLEELLLVRGVGAGVLEAIRPVVSLFGSGKVNINSASAKVLNCIAHRWGGDPELTRSLVRKIMEFRSAGGSFESADPTVLCQTLDTANDLTVEETTLLKKMAGSAQVHSVFYGGIAEARLAAGKRAETRIRFVFERNRQEKVYWYEY